MPNFHWPDWACGRYASSMSSDPRYHRQTLLPGIGERGQERLRDSTVLIAGCGALGTVAADLLCRAGVGTLVIVDRDVVEATNLQRQTLFTERDAERGIPKAEAARLRLGQANSTVRIRAFVEDIDAGTVGAVAAGCDLVLDGLDNFETRYLLNDYAVANGIPYIYGAAVATEGMTMPILPRGGPGEDARIQWADREATPCLRCLFPEPPPPGTTPTCDTAGVLGSVTAMVAAHQVSQVIKLIVGDIAAVDRTLRSFDLWTNKHRAMDTSAASNPECTCCVHAHFEFLDSEAASARMLCGRNAVQLRPGRTRSSFDLDRIERVLAAHGDFKRGAASVRGVLEGERSPSGHPVSMLVFEDGRAIVEGDTDLDWARGVFDRFIGS
jgi:molybdopterin-synthase adenylyltransferase